MSKAFFSYFFFSYVFFSLCDLKYHELAWFVLNSTFPEVINQRELFVLLMYFMFMCGFQEKLFPLLSQLGWNIDFTYGHNMEVEM